MRYFAPLAIAILSTAIPSCIDEPVQDVDVEFRGTGTGEHQIIMRYDSAGQPLTDCTFWPVEHDQCCDFYNADGSYTSTPCKPKVGSYCSRGWTEEDVCVVPEEQPGDSIICIGSPYTCGSTSEDQECYWTFVMSDSGSWGWQWVCLDWAPSCAGGGGDAEEGPCPEGD